MNRLHLVFSVSMFIILKSAGENIHESKLIPLFKSILSSFGFNNVSVEALISSCIDPQISTC
jgi:hypothetical protein